MLHVFVEFKDGAQIAEVPVERCLVANHARSNARHDHVAAVA
jgi:hypothetical protein